MSERELQDALETILDQLSAGCEVVPEDLSDGDNPIRKIRTFAEDGLMTDNKGLVIGFADGSEFQLSIVQSR